MEVQWQGLSIQIESFSMNLRCIWVSEWISEFWCLCQCVNVSPHTTLIERIAIKIDKFIALVKQTIRDFSALFEGARDCEKIGAIVFFSFCVGFDKNYQVLFDLVWFTGVFFGRHAPMKLPFRNNAAQSHFLIEFLRDKPCNKMQIDL